MTTIFPKWTNRLPTMALLGALGTLVAVVWAGWYWLTPDFFKAGYMPRQPVDYSHQIHSGQLGIDCRYCHTHVEESYHANVPSSATCMSCHTVVNQNTGYLKKAVSVDGQTPSAHWSNTNLALLRAAHDSGRPVRWRRVHKMPDYARFPHAAHVKAGISCYSCHGRIDTMPVVFQAHGMGMGWCLDCHREPEKHLVDTRGLFGEAVRITDLRAVEQTLAERDASRRRMQLEMGKRISEALKLHPPQNCSACHY